MQLFIDVERIRCRTLSRSRDQGGRSRLQLSRPNVGCSKHWRLPMNELKAFGEVSSPIAIGEKILDSNQLKEQVRLT